jgi:hypothetical protein
MKPHISGLLSATIRYKSLIFKIEAIAPEHFPILQYLRHQLLNFNRHVPIAGNEL